MPWCAGGDLPAVSLRGLFAVSILGVSVSFVKDATSIGLGFVHAIPISLSYLFKVDLSPNVVTPLPTSTPILSGHHHTVVCVCGLCMYVFWLILSPSFIQFLPSPYLYSDSC